MIVRESVSDLAVCAALIHAAVTALFAAVVIAGAAASASVQPATMQQRTPG